MRADKKKYCKIKIWLLSFVVTIIMAGIIYYTNTDFQPNPVSTKELKSLISKSVQDSVQNMQPYGSILAGDNKSIIYSQSFGYADIKSRAPNTTTTQFLIGSVTKQFTAVAILRALYDQALNTGLAKDDTASLNEAIKTELHKPISHFLPKDHAIWSGAMPKWANVVTTHQLLVHSSGLVNFTSLPKYRELATEQYEPADLISFFKDYDLEFTPGSKYSYSNSGYMLLGEIIAQITGTQLDKYMEMTLFKAHAMYATSLPTKGTAPDLQLSDLRFVNLAGGYEFDVLEQETNVTEVKTYEAMQIPGGAGSIISTTSDLLKWNRALYSGEIIPDFLLKLMLTPHIYMPKGDDQNIFYGYGIIVSNSDNLGVYYSHNGMINGYRSDLTYIPSLKLTLACLTNLMPNFDSLEPEIKKITAELTASLSESNKWKKIDETLIANHPIITINKNKYDFMLVNKAVIKELEEFKFSNSMRQVVTSSGNS